MPLHNIFSDIPSHRNQINFNGNWVLCQCRIWSPFFSVSHFYRGNFQTSTAGIFTNKFSQGKKNSEGYRTGRHRYSVVYILQSFKIFIILFADQLCDSLKTLRKQKTLIFAAHCHYTGHVLFKTAIYLLYTQLLFYCLILPPL